MKIRYFAIIAMLASSSTYCSPRQDSSGGIWSDDFSDYSGLSHRQQAALSGFGGITVDSGLQSWSQPQSSTMFSQPFSSSRASMSLGLLANNIGGASETLTLWRTRLDPGVSLVIGSNCNPATIADTCINHGVLSVASLNNGDLRPGFIINIPQDPDPGSGAFWGMETKALVWGCNTMSPRASLDSIFNANLPLLNGAKVGNLAPGVDYDVTVLASQANSELPGSRVNYMVLKAVNVATSAVHGVPLVINEKDLIGTTIDSSGMFYNAMVPLNLHLTGLPKAVWDLQVWPLNNTHQHCTALGPIYVTASVGNYKSPVLDTLSSKTKWVSISWSIDQSTDYADSGSSAKCTVTPLGCGFSDCICPESAIAITPVMLDYSVDNTAPYSGTSVDWGVEHYDWQLPGLQTVPTQDYTIMNSSTPMADATGVGPLNGRYFQYKLDMYGRGSAGGLYPALAPAAMHPGTPNIYFGGFRPTVRRVAVNYFACAAMVISDAIAPSSVKKWGKVTFRSYHPTPGASVAIDVLSEDGVVLKAGINSGDSIGDLDTYSYPRLKLRATLVSDPADCNQRPVLESWKMDWQPNPELLTLDRNGFWPDRGETVKAQVRVDRPGRVIVRVHDVSGQAIKLLLDGDQPAQATLIVWDGRNERGDKVAPGVYFMSAGVPGAGKVKRVAVLR